MDIHVKKSQLLDKNIGNLFSLIMLQYTESLQDKLFILPMFQAIEDERSIFRASEKHGIFF